MGLTPVEIRHVPIGRGFWGYRRGPVERLLDEVAESFEEVWRERADFADRIEHLEEELQRHRELESLLRRTLVSAEAAAQEQREGARRDAERVVAEAHAEARRITFAATAERERLQGDIRRLRELLRTALSTVEAGNGADEDTMAGEDTAVEAA
jgi:cell division initiation protein